MNTTKTISVEPAKITLADKKNKELAMQFLRTSVLNKDYDHNHKKEILNLLFPTQNLANETFVKFSVPLRTIFSAVLIVSGISYFEGNGLGIGSLWISILEIIFGTFLALGLFSRIVMGGATVIFALTGLIALRHGINDVTAFSMMFGSLIFFVMGAGKYSCDSMIRKYIRKREIIKRRKSQDEYVSYKAFSYVTRNL